MAHAKIQRGFVENPQKENLASKKFDVVIAGAGPAGSFLAYNLAKKGISVGLFERKQLPRYKACGGGITQKALDILDFDVTPVIHSTPQTAAIALNGRDVRILTPARPVARTVMRDSFDYFLVERACDAGAHLVEGKTVSAVDERGRVKIGSETVVGDVVVGADGVLSTIAQQAGIRKRFQAATAIEAEVYVSDELLARFQDTAFFDFGAIRMGYGWVFPKRDHLSVGLCTVKRKPGSLNGLLREFIDRHLEKGNPKIGVQQGHLVPSGDTAASFSRGQVLLVGDAAGLADPFTGEGIFYALKSADIAAGAIERFLSGKDSSLSDYDGRIVSEFRQDFLWARRASRLIYHFPYLSHKMFVGNRFIANGFVRVLAGEERYWPFIKSSLTDVASVVRGFRSNSGS